VAAITAHQMTTHFRLLHFVESNPCLLCLCVLLQKCHNKITKQIVHNLKIAFIMVYHEHEPHASVRHLHFVRTSLDGVSLPLLP
jgi:hypothetical protein